MNGHVHPELALQVREATDWNPHSALAPNQAPRYTIQYLLDKLTPVEPILWKAPVGWSASGHDFVINADTPADALAQLVLMIFEQAPEVKL